VTDSLQIEQTDSRQELRGTYLDRNVPTNPIPRDTIAKLALWRDEKGIARSFLGTCFAFPSPKHFLTAAHCVATLEPSSLRVDAVFGGIFQKARVKWISCHPQADLALLGVSTSPWVSARPFERVRPQPLLGEPFYAFGYPLDLFSADPNQETDRLFRGHLQRLFYYSSPITRTTYPAFELNIPCPHGLSGGPVFVTEGEFEVMGIVTENLESTNYRWEEESLTRDGTTQRTVYSQIINYGVALQLGPYVDWIDDVIARHKDR
jgi:Trypsin-like peptidase domain